MSKENHFQFIGSSANNDVTLLSANISDFSYDKHAHEEYSLGVTLRGRQDFFCHNSFYKSFVGGVLLFNPEDVHDGHSGAEESLFYHMLYIHPDKLRPYFRTLGYNKDEPLRIGGAVHDDLILRHQILSMSELINNENAASLEQDGLLFQIAHSMVRMSGELGDKPVPQRRSDTLLLKAKEYIHSNLENDISIDDICRAANISKYHFIRMFRTQFGITPHQYVLNCRLNRAQKALEQGFPASRVAQESGFADSSHLNRRFKRVFGITPKQYQMQSQLSSK